MKFRVGACALLVCLAGCTAETPGTKFGDQRGAASVNARTAQRLPSVQTRRDIDQSIANAPDRGELIQYKNKGAATKREGAYTWFPVAISEAHALKAVVGGIMTIPSPDGSQVKLRYERHVEHPDGNWTWIGRVIGGDQKQEAILTFGEKAVFGSIPQKTGSPLNLQTRGSTLYVVQTDQSKVKNPNSSSDMMVPPAAAFRSQLLAAASKTQVSQSAGETKAATPATTIDIALGYSAGLRAVYGSQSATVTRLVNLVDVGNQAFNNSQITGALRIVNAVEVNYADNTTNKAALGELTGTTGTAPVTIPASLAPLRTAREQYGADLAVLVRKFQTPENQGCGIAWLNGSGGVAIDPTTDDDFGFAVISDGTDTGTDNNTYFCAVESLIHEVGHLMGSAHDRDNSKINPDLPSGGTNLLFGRYPYSFGMKTTAANGNFYTIMAYGDDNQDFYRTFSNPLVLKCGPADNLPCGVTDQTDNARSLNQTIPVVAQFRAMAVPLGVVANDFNGDGRSDIYWRNMSTGVNDEWHMNGSAISSSGTVYIEANQAWKVVGTGDFNGDNKADVLWRNFTTGQLYIQHMDGRTVLATSGTSNTVADKNWQIAALADFDGDEITDILWRNTVLGTHDIWLMSGRAPRAQQFVYHEPNLAWKVIGAADFNGDGMADILWRNSSTGENYIVFMRSFAVQAGSGFTRRESNQAWKIVAIRDFDGDGIADIYWRNDTTGVNHLWKMNGTTVVTDTQVYVEPNQTWKIVNSGDYNGDGYADVLWRNSTSGQNYMQLMRGAQILSASEIYRVPDTNWQIMGGDRVPAN